MRRRPEIVPADVAVSTPVQPVDVIGDGDSLDDEDDFCDQFMANIDNVNVSSG